MERLILPISPIMPIAFLKLMKASEQVLIDPYEHYVKQTVRNRYFILTANGVIPLTINVVGLKGEKIPTGQVAIDYSKPWVRTHLRAIESAYRSAPFFEHYFYRFERLIKGPYPDLQNMFQASAREWFPTLGLKYNLSETFIEDTGDYDLRNPAIKTPDPYPESLTFQPYPQVFEDRFRFKANLSIIDLLMNEGPAAASYL